MLTKALPVILMIGVVMINGCASTPDHAPASPALEPSATPAGVRQVTATELFAPATPPSVQPLPATPQSIQPATASASAQESDEYRIGPQDLVEIQVFGVGELMRTVRVNAAGLISLPLIGQIKAAGLTSQALEAAIAERLTRDYLQDPQVTVFIKEYTSQRVTVEGAVKKPGIYPIKGRTTLMQAIALAEGLSELADSSEVKVFRAQPSGPKVALQFSLDDIRDGTSADPSIRDDDLIVVSTDTTRTVVKGVADTLRGFVQPFVFFR